ncbi:MAG TPA: hypothetical protein PLT64_04165 [Syntrophales bacterium]|nr:hypothetical protein [Syntrophales bacterium]HOL59047.1 hypothetical protein [Syntrophales bacterium]HPO35444.1 hypothetical protein [Syntrophales bacterium]
MGKLRKIFILIAVGSILIASGALALDIGRYQVVAGNEDKAYLVDTSTGAVWVLTHRTLPTGREPIAIPYKFIKISPKQQNEFLMEKIQEPGAVEADK